MIRVSEFVLPGHPDKFCDAMAEAIIGEVLKVDADGYGQVEVAVWSDRVFLTGGVCTRRPPPPTRVRQPRGRRRSPGLNTS